MRIVKDFEALDLQKIADEHNVEMEVDTGNQPGEKLVRFEKHGMWFQDFCFALNSLTGIAARNKMDEQKRKNEEFLKKQ